jgi:predicted HTH transcriptional regulator
MTMTVEVKSKQRWTSKDREWLLDTVEYLRNDGYPRVAAMLRESIAAIKDDEE